MSTINKRVSKPQAYVINGVDAGGGMTVAIQEGWEEILRSAPDGLQFPIVDKACQFCRGVIVSQDWTQMINLLTGTGNYVFYERASGAVEAAGYTKHTINNPIIHQVHLRFNQKGYATIQAAFECMAADPTKTISDMHQIQTGQAAPTYIPAARGGWRIVSIVFGSVNAYHGMALSFSITMPLSKACNDGDIAYTAVDAFLNGMTTAGSIELQDSSVYQSLLTGAINNLVITVKQSQGAANKILTIANVSFLHTAENSDVHAEYTHYTLGFEVVNDPNTPLTLAGTNKIITIADAS
jgi:nitrogen fixation protein